MRTPDQIKDEDQQFADFMRRLSGKRPGGYRTGSFLSFAWMLYKIHRRAKKYGIGTIMQIKIGKDL